MILDPFRTIFQIRKLVLWIVVMRDENVLALSIVQHKLVNAAGRAYQVMNQETVIRRLQNYHQEMFRRCVNCCMREDASGAHDL